MIQQLSFRSHFLAKLNVILKVTRTKAKAARKIGIPVRQFYRWFQNDRIIAPARRYALKVDEVYMVAWERLHRTRKSKEQQPSP